jgi:hypothetical protein
MLREAVRDMPDESIRDVKFDNYVLHVRKHVNDVYSGRIEDGHKQVHQFTNKSLPAVAAELMSVFEWYLPEDEGVFDILDEKDLQDDAIDGGLNNLIDNYHKHNIGNIYQEMEHIRTEIRNGNAVDLQQVEQRIMKLFDKLEDTILNVVDKHNKLKDEAGGAVDELENKLRELQDKVEALSKKPVTMDAYSSNPPDSNRVYQDYYSYLPKPTISISPVGQITITFDSGWTNLDRENFLQDMKAKIVKKSIKSK